MNEDRHLNNFGIIRDVNTLKWLDVAPIFDNGQSLNIAYYDDEEMHITGEGKLFYGVKPFDEIIKIVKDIKRIDVTKLDDIPKWFDNLLHEYQDITGYSDKRINKICILFRVLTKFNTLFFFSKVLYNYFVRLLIISTILSLQALLFYRKNDIIILLR